MASMLARVPRVPISLDPLIAEAKRRAHRRWLIITLSVAVLAAGSAAALAPRSSGPSGAPTPGAAINGRASYSPGQVKAAFAAEGIQLSKYGGHVQFRGVISLVSGMGVWVGIWIGHHRPPRNSMGESYWRRAHQGNLKLSWSPSLNRRVRVALSRLG
jgi:hypothetical protein